MLRTLDPTTIDGFYKYVEGGAFVSEELAEDYRSKIMDFFIISRYHNVDPDLDFIRQGDTGTWFVSDRVLMAIVDIHDLTSEKLKQENEI